MISRDPRTFEELHKANINGGFFKCLKIDDEFSVVIDNHRSFNMYVLNGQSLSNTIG